MRGIGKLRLDDVQEPVILQGWFPPQAEHLACGMAEAGCLGVIRVSAFPDMSALDERLAGLSEVKGRIGLDIKGFLGQIDEVLEVAKQRGVSFLVHGAQLRENMRERLQACELPRLVNVENLEEALHAYREGAHALVVAGREALRQRMEEIRKHLPLPLLPEASMNAAEAAELLEQPGVKGLQVRSPELLLEGVREKLRGFPERMSQRLEQSLESLRKALPRLRIRDFEVPYPIVQGGMGVGVSWEGLAGSVAASGAIGLVSAIGTGYRHPELATFAQGRPVGFENLNHGEALKRILRDAHRLGGPKGIVGVNILCAINGYEQVVRDSIEGGARMIVSGAGLPLSLPELASGSNAALVPIVSSDRALRIICKTWDRKYKRLPDAVILEGPESGGHQGFSVEHCSDPNHTLENLLGPVLEERDRWGDFPVIVAGGVWDRDDIDRFLALGAGGVQMATRFIGTFECDADLAFKSTILKSCREDIRLVKSPVGMPGRAVQTGLQQHISDGTAPAVKCISHCVSPCDHGVGARLAGYCIADRLNDAREGKTDTGLFFTGSNGWKLQDFVPVRELMEELTGDFGLRRLNA